ncbi:MAG: tetratricopeptide repeat protein [Deltaproteobacteria bacterium]|nr:tetratricopeptide repeat protein [Deltaproteobacteria bacterium]
MAINKRKVLDAARKYVQKGAQAKALKEFQKLLKLDPRDARLRLEVGDAYRRWGDNAKAIETYAKVASQYSKEGFDARAVAVYKQIHNLDAEAYETYEPLAELYQRMGLTAEAIGALQTAADGFHKQDRKPEALELLRKMATLDPTNTSSRIKVADLLKHEELLDEAIAEYEAASSELERQGDADAAAAVYQRILEIKPDRLDTLIQLARNLIDRGLGERAESFAKRILENQPEEPAHYEMMAAVYRLQSRDEELADTYRNLAELHRRRGDEEQAREILQRYVPSGEFDQDLGLDDETAFGAMGSEIPLVGDGGFDSEVEDANEATLGGIGGSDFDELILDTEAPSGEDETILDDEKDDDASLEVDDDDLLLELDSSDEAIEVGPSESAPPSRPPPAGDPDQLLAEASVYLRYGKRDQAIENIEAIIAQNSEHRPAFEKLGEAYADGDQPAKAVENWLRAAELARAAGDVHGLSVLRDRIGALDEAAAATIATLEPEADAAVAESVEPDAGSGLAAEATVIDIDSIDLSESEPEASHEIDLDDIEIDLDDSDFEDAFEEAEDGDSSDVGLSEDVDSGPTETAEAAAESSGIAGASAAMVQQVGEDLEEADFYMNQGLADEAEAIYQRVLSIAPNHPHALVRLGEVAAMRGEDPTTASVTNPDADSMTLDTAPSDGEVEEDDSSSWSDDIGGPDSLEPDADITGGDSSDYLAEVTEPDGVAAFDDMSAPLEDISAEDSDALATTVSDESLELASDGEPRLPTPEDEVVSSPIPDDVHDDESELISADEAEEAATVADEADEADDEDAASLDQGEPIEIASPDDSNSSSTPDLGEPPDLVVEPESEPAAAGFDLAAELNDVFDDDGSSGTMSGLGDSDDGFAAVFSAFKKGVSETLSEGDHEAHFDLGIAYREMGLFDDAKGEFLAAMKKPESEFECRHMIGLCCFEMGQYEQAVAEFEQIIAAETASDEKKLTARLELGRCWQQLGEPDRARSAFELVAAVDPSFCEVSELLIGLEASEKPDADVPNLEEFESFEDLMLDDAVEADDEASDPPTAEYESFDGFLEDETDYESDPESEVAADAVAEIVAEPVPESEPAADVSPDPPKKKKRRKISFV